MHPSEPIVSAIQDQIPVIYAVGIAAALAIIAVFSTFKWRASARARAAQALHVAELEEKYRPILNIDRAVAESERRLAEAEGAFQAQKLLHDKTVTDLKTDYAKRFATRVGYVYVISNVGAFGENVFKIGMTRRLEPLDRVRELGDASVPFPFDVHALIFTEDAPALERALQVELDAHRVNRVNPRKEFFRVPPEALKAKVKARFADVVYLDRPEAEEYLQSLPKAVIESMAATEREEAFPAAI